MTVRNVTREVDLAHSAREAIGGRERRRGLIGRPEMSPGEALVLPRCRQVHTFGMRFSIDVIFLDRRGRIVRTCRGLRPYRVSPVVWLARTVVEMPARTLEDTKTETGDLVVIEKVEEPGS